MTTKLETYKILARVESLILKIDETQTLLTCGQVDRDLESYFLVLESQIDVLLHRLSEYHGKAVVPIEDTKEETKPIISA